jgi:hypothetical protein
MDTREWRFFDDARGRWNWEVLDSFGGVVDESPYPMATFELCMEHARAHGLKPEHTINIFGDVPQLHTA